MVKNTIAAAVAGSSGIIALAGGVAANSLLRSVMKEEAGKRGIEVYYPKPVLCTDNAAMIAGAAYFEFMSGNEADLTLNAIPGLKLGDR